MLKKLMLTTLLISSLFALDISWEKDYQSAVKNAKLQNKPLLFIISNNDCKYCILLDNTTLKDKRVVQELNKNFVSSIAYIDKNHFVPNNLYTGATPSLWFLYPNERPIFQAISGAIGADDFLNALEIVKKEFKSNKDMNQK